MTDINTPSDTQPEDDPWAAAMSEQAAAAPVQASSEGVEQVFKPLATDGASKPAQEMRPLEMIQEIPVTMSAILGKTTMTIKELLALSQGSVVQLEGMAGAPLQILVNNYPFAKGEVVVVNEHYGIRITEIMTPSERMQKFTK